MLDVHEDRFGINMHVAVSDSKKVSSKPKTCWDLFYRDRKLKLLIRLHMMELRRLKRDIEMFENTKRFKRVMI